jgi:hypothetical protein
MPDYYLPSNILDLEISLESIAAIANTDLQGCCHHCDTVSLCKHEKLYSLLAANMDTRK